MIIDHVDHVADSLRWIEDIFNFYINFYPTFRDIGSVKWFIIWSTQRNVLYRRKV